MKNLFRGLSLIVTLGLILAACGGPATEAPAPTEAPEATEAPAATVAPAATEIPAATEVSAEPKILTLRLADSDIANLDAAFYVTMEDELVSLNIHQGLVAFKPGSYEVVNVLAESISQSEDGLTIDFKLKEGIQFHAGYGEMTAEDVKFSYERFIDPALNSPYNVDWAALDHVEVTGTYTGQIILKEPFAPLWTTTLPIGGGWVVSKAAYEEKGPEGYATSPVGTGPYEFVEWVPNQRVVLKRFADYWGDPPEWDELHFLPILEDSAAEIALETGELDFGAISSASIERFEANADFVVDPVDTPNYQWVAMNVQHPKLQDINVRQAVRYGIDVPAVIEAAYDGKWARACNIVAPGLVGYWEDAPCYERDVAKAKEFMQQAGLAEGLDLTLTILTTEADKAAAEVIQANLAEVGINIEIVAQDDSAFYDGGFGAKAIEERQLTYVYYVTNPDAYWDMTWFTCEQVEQWNWMYLCDEEFDRLNEEARRELDPPKRADMYIQMQQIWDNVAHAVWIAYPTWYFVSPTDLEPSFLPNGRYIAWNFHSK